MGKKANDGFQKCRILIALFTLSLIEIYFV